MPFTNSCISVNLQPQAPHIELLPDNRYVKKKLKGD
jgi:hypothetical protein